MSEELKIPGEQYDRVRAYSPAEASRQVDRDTQQCLEALAEGPTSAINSHIDQLNREWDMERYLQMNASVLALAGVVLGATRSKKWLALPGIVFTFFLQHGIQGWCPPLPVFRRMGVRTRKEIDREKYALKALRGDFEKVSKEEDEAA